MLSMACIVDHLALHSGGLLSCSELVPRGKPLCVGPSHCLSAVRE